MQSKHKIYTIGNYTNVVINRKEIYLVEKLIKETVLIGPCDNTLNYNNYFKKIVKEIGIQTYRAKLKS